MQYLAFDIETTGLDPYKDARVFAYSTCDEHGNVQVLRLDRKDEQRNRTQLQDLFNNTDIAKVCHNFHFEYSVLRAEGFHIPDKTEWHDTMLMSQILDNLAPSHALDELVDKFERDPKRRQLYRDIDGKINRARKIYPSYKEIPQHLMDPYQRADAERTMLLFSCFYPRIKANQKVLDCYLNEIELVKVTTLMEERGILLARKEADKLMKWLNDELDQNHHDCVNILGSYINFGSYKAVSKLLFVDMGLPRISTTDSGNHAVDKNALEELALICSSDKQRKILDMILKHRSYVKGIAMIRSYLEAAGPDDVIHPHINTNQAHTGRESSTNPNMQNISKEVALKTKFPVPARRCFRARPKHLLLLCDYAGIEMRLAVQATGSDRLARMLHDEFDFHDACAKQFYGSRYIDETDPKRKKMLRSAAKNGRFAMLYGAGLEQVSYTLGLSLEETRVGYDRDREEFPEFYDLMNRCTYQARRHGYIETFWGRRLHVNPNKPYVATDYLIQGSAAELFKRAQVRVTGILNAWLPEVRLLLPVHDEFIFETSRILLHNIEHVKLLIGHELTQGYPEITVHLSVEWKMSPYTWDQAKELT